MPNRVVTRRAITGICAAASLAFAPGVVASAAAADFAPAPGTYEVNTTTLELTGPGTAISGRDEGGVAVFSFDGVFVPNGVVINVQGSRPFELRAAGALSFNGTINGNGRNATDGMAGPHPGGPGGGAGAQTSAQPAGGPGAGGPGNSSVGAGGGGFGGAGARGGPLPGGSAGPAYGNLDTTIQGGSGGGGGVITGGGGGGGAVRLVASSVSVGSTGVVRVDGGHGAVAAGGGAGGGSGGGIIIRGDIVDVDGTLSAVGGNGGRGGCCGDGGGGGGGRIAYQYKIFLGEGTNNVSGGTSGTVTTSGCCDSGGDGDPAGQSGVVTRTKITDPPPPSSDPPPPSSGGTTGSGTVDTTAPAASATVPLQTLGSVTESGKLRIRVKTNEAGSISGQAYLDSRLAKRLRLPANGQVFTSAPAIVATGKATASRAATFTVTLKLTRKARAKLATLKRVKLSLRVRVADAAGNRRLVKSSVTLRR